MRLSLLQLCYESANSLASELYNCTDVQEHHVVHAGAICMQGLHSDQALVSCRQQDSLHIFLLLSLLARRSKVALHITT